MFWPWNPLRTSPLSIWKIQTTWKTNMPKVQLVVALCWTAIHNPCDLVFKHIQTPFIALGASLQIIIMFKSSPCSLVMINWNHLDHLDHEYILRILRIQMPQMLGVVQSQKRDHTAFGGNLSDDWNPWNPSRPFRQIGDCFNQNDSAKCCLITYVRGYYISILYKGLITNYKGLSCY